MKHHFLLYTCDSSFMHSTVWFASVLYQSLIPTTTKILLAPSHTVWHAVHLHDHCFVRSENTFSQRWNISALNTCVLKTSSTLCLTMNLHTLAVNFHTTPTVLCIFIKYGSSDVRNYWCSAVSLHLAQLQSFEFWQLKLLKNQWKT